MWPKYYFDKISALCLSHIAQNQRGQLMSDMKLQGTTVTICDWNGRVVWTSSNDIMTKSGDFAWEHIEPSMRKEAETAFSRVVAIRETFVLEFENEREECFRCWLWPLASPDTAVCVLTISIPAELKLLTPRERDVLGFLALGHTTKEIAADIDVSTSTVHSHLRKAREKLSLHNMEAITGFAARYCHPHAAPS